MIEISGTLSTLFVQLPVIFTWLAGIAWAFNTGWQQPRRARLALFAFGLLLFELLIGTHLNLWSPIWLRAAGWTLGDITLWSFFLSFGEAVIRALAWVILLVAIFGQRK
jgi:hypothetical protein